MQLIAHRVFEDHIPTDAFDPARIEGYDGAEFDLRSFSDGETFIYHAPFIATRRSRRFTPDKRLEAVIHLLTDRPQPPKTLIFDVKTLGAAVHGAEFVASGALPPATAPLFLVWRVEELREIKARLPEARVFFVIAPIVARRLLRYAPTDLYFFNHFPWVSRSTRYRPKPGKANNHNINVRLFHRGAAARLAPEGADGVCLNRRFLGAALVETARAQGLGVAVYGFRSRRDALHCGFAEALDYAIISDKESLRREAAARAVEARAVKRAARRGPGAQEALSARRK